MRLLAIIFAAAVAIPAAHASTIQNNFTYTYTVGSSSYTNSFSLLNGQTPDAIQPATSTSETEYVYNNVVLNGDPGTTATVTFQSFAYTYNTSSQKFEYGLIFTLGSGHPSAPYDYGAYAGQDIEFTGVPTFSPNSIRFAQGYVQLEASQLSFDSSYLTIAQTTVPTPASVTPEPATLSLLTTGVLGTAAAVRRRKLTRS